MGRYARLLQEAAGDGEVADPARDKRERMHAYVRGRRRPAAEGGGDGSGGGLRDEQARRMAGLLALCGLVEHRPGGLSAGYALARLKRKYPVEYARLRDISAGR